VFLGARSPGSAPGAPVAVILGAPYDRSSSFRRGARFGPGAIRWASHSIESYSPILDRDLEELVLIDHGDLDIEALPPGAMVEAVRSALTDVAAEGSLPVLLGGDHSVSVGAVRALAARHPDLRVLILDAHLDLRGEYEGSRWSHATVTRRLLESLGPERIIILGARSGTREEFAAARAMRAVQPHLRIPHDLWTALEDGPLYLSMDIDVVDPSAAPGVGNPEPGGPTAAEAIDLVRVLAPLRIVGVDVVELSPPFDPSGRTAVLAAMFIREALLTWAK
jgi:agmatinase